MIIITIIWLLLSLYILSVVCDRYFVDSLDQIAKKYHISDDVAGATLMAIGSSSPEFFTSLIALLHGGKVWLWAGTIIGSAIFNLLIIIGISALYMNERIMIKPFIRDSIFYAGSIWLIWYTFWDGIITGWESVLFLVWYGIYILYLIYWPHEPDQHQDTLIQGEVEEFTKEESSWADRLAIIKWIDTFIHWTFPRQTNRYWLVFTISLVWIIAMSWVLVESGVTIAHIFGIPEVIIGLTILAAGTSFPDLLSSVIVAKQGRGNMAISNAIGSNVFDICICLWLPWLIYTLAGHTVDVYTGDLSQSLITLVAVLVVLVAAIFINKRVVNKTIGRIFISMYIIYFAVTVIQAFI